MTRIRLLLATLLISMPLVAAAQISADDLPYGTVWYLHADLGQMRAIESGRELYAWLQDEVFVEINEELGIDLNEEIDRVTAFSDTGAGAVVVLEGPIGAAFQSQVLALARAKGDLETREHRGKTYFQLGDGERRGNAGSNGIEAFEDSSFFTFGVSGKAIAASDEERLKAMIDTNGRIAGAGAHRDALFVLTADKDFVQAGMRTAEFADDDDDWDSNILRNTEQAALLVSDKGGMIAVEARLVSSDPKMAGSIGGIVNGLISLQAFNSELDPAVAGVLQNTRVVVAEKVLSISTVIDPSMVVAILKD